MHLTVAVPAKVRYQRPNAPGQEKFESQAMKVVVISPHRDDVAFSLSLAVAGWIEQGHDVDVVCCFTQTAYAPLAHEAPAEIGLRIEAVSALRLGEDEAWADIIRGLCARSCDPTEQGRLRIVDLKLRDAPLRLGAAVDRVCSTAATDADAAGRSIEEYISGSGADALLLPLAAGGHVDHRTARNAGVRVLKTLGCGQAFAFYEDLPYAARPGAAEGLAAAADATNMGLLCGSVGLPDDAGQAEAHKLRAISCYGSQVSTEEMHAMAAFCRKYGGRERLWANAEFWGSHLASERQKRREATLV